MAAERTYALIVNPSSGSGRGGGRLPAIESELEERGLEHRVVMTRSLEHGVEEARAAAASGSVPVVISGDGLIGAVGGALAGSETPLGVIPGGRGNDFARALNIPNEIPEAVALLATGTERRIDVGEVNDKRFLTITSCGFDSDCIDRANRVRLVRGNLVYVYSAFRTIATWRPAEFTVTIDGETRRYEGFSVAVANSRFFGGGMMVAPEAQLDDAKLDVVMIGGHGKLRYISNLPKVFKGEHVDEDEVTVVRGSQVEINADRPFTVYGDGEALTGLPAKLRALPGALRVIAPAP